jgi:hypothetical protein
MRVLDWLFLRFFHGTLDQGSRPERANFLLWFSTSFLWVAVFYFILSILGLHIPKSLFMPIFLAVFAVNYFTLRRVYLKSNRSKSVIEKGRDKQGNKALAIAFVFFALFLAVAIALGMIIYYGKNIGYVK